MVTSAPVVVIMRLAAVELLLLFAIVIVEEEALKIRICLPSIPPAMPVKVATSEPV